MLIFILTDVQYSQKAVFSFEKGSDRQNHSSSGSLHPVKKFPSTIKFLIERGGRISPPPPPPYPHFEKPGRA